jgi:hypothetical protein
VLCFQALFSPPVIGIGPANEVVFFHKASATLILTDLVVYINGKVSKRSRGGSGPPSPWQANQLQAGRSPFVTPHLGRSEGV